MNKEKGFINLDLTPLFWFAGIGLVAMLVGIPWLLYWLIVHVSIIVV